MKIKENFKYINNDLPASIVVFFVALPLCLGIALASGAPLFSGIIAGVVGGIIVGMTSGSSLGVSGPAAGLAVIVFSSVTELGSWEIFLLAVVLAGIIQLIAGYFKLGSIAWYFPSSVIKGMLTGIGFLIILKQIPHLVGHDADFEGNFQFFQQDGQNTFSELLNMIHYITPGAVLISAVSLSMLLLWDIVLSKKHKFFTLVNGPLVVVLFSVFINYLYQSGFIALSLSQHQIVNIPAANGLAGFLQNFSFPDFSQLGNYNVYKIAFVLAIVASLETLLSVEATDKMDPQKRITPVNRELKAQGLGNIISGMIGGLPITQVIVRSSSNIAFGGKSRMSAVLHGLFLMVSVIAIPGFLNMIPLSALAAILLLIGYKLAHPSIFNKMYRLGTEQFVPFMATVAGILLTDLLIGIGIGMVFAIFYILLNNLKNPYIVDIIEGEDQHHITLSEEVSFLNKGRIIKILKEIPDHSTVIIDGSRTKSIHSDVCEIIHDFIINAVTKNIKVEVKGVKDDNACYYP